MKRFLLFLTAILLISGVSYGQISVTGCVGAGDGTYATLGAAITTIGTAQPAANIVISVTGSTTETATVSIGAGTWTSMTIQPSGGAWTISGAIAAGSPLIEFLGADNVTINGLNSGGNALTISNTTASATSGTSTIKFITDATNNVITNCSILGSGSMAVGTNGGNIWFAAGAVATGSDNNTISYCQIGPAGSNLPTKGIYANGTTTTTALNNSGMVISNNQFFDYFGAAASSAGMYISTGNTAWLISNNKFYQTATRTATSGITHSGIYIANTTSADGFSIIGNTIGYASAAGTGTYTVAGGFSNSFYGIYLSGLSTSTTNLINNNLIANISFSTTSSGSTGGSYPFAGINCANGAGTISISSNTIMHVLFTGTGTGAFTGIDLNSSGTGVHSVNGNLIADLVRTATGNLYGIRMSSPTTVTFNNNTINYLAINNTTSTSTLAGIYGLSSSINVTATGNNIYNLTSTSTGSVSIIGIREFGSTGNKVYQNNIIHDLIAGGGTASIYGIYPSTSSSPNPMDISGNTIYTLSGGSTIYPISQSSSSATANIYKNKIYDITGFGTSASVYGIYIGSGTTLNIYNNLIGDLKAPTATGLNAINGIYGSATSTYNVYYNTVHLNATSSSATTFGTSCAYFGSSATSFNLRNNILVNLSTPAQEGTNVGTNGISACLRRSGGTAATVPANYATTSNNNDFWCNPSAGTNNHLTYVEGLATITNPFNTLVPFKTFLVNRDQQSVAENAPFVSTTGSNPAFLHISTTTPTFMESGAANISTFTDDFDANVRQGNPGYTGTGTAPDIGADEFEGTPIPLCSGIPSASTINGIESVCAGLGTTLTLSTAYTDLGISYQWKSSPTAGGPFTDAGTGTSLPTGPLSANTYYICVITCSYSGESFTTDEKSVLVKPVPSAVASNDSPVCAGSTLNLTGTSDIGTTFSWTGVNGFASTSQNPNIVNVTTAAAGAYSFTATADGCSSAPSITNVTINPAPTSVTASASSSAVCAGIPFDLFSSAISNSPSSSYTTSTILSPTADGGFETGGTFPLNNWSVLNGTYNNWFVGNAAGVQGGSNAAYAGTAFVGTGNTSVNHFYRDIVIPAGSINVNLSFYLKMPIIDNTYDYLYVFTTTTANTPVTGTVPSTGYTTVLSYTTPALSGYTLQSFTLPNALAGTTVRIVFTYKSDGFSPYAVPAVDNISMVADVPVPVPATFSWTSSPAGFTSTEQNPVGVVQSTETQYIITAFNSYGCYAWNSTTVTMAEGAAIAVQPVPATKCSGQTATFSVTATGPGLLYQWRKGGIDIDPGTNPSAATNILSLSGVTTGDEATYDVVISSSCGTPITSDGAALTVIPSPVVTVSPPAASYCTPGSPLTLTASGAESYSWSPATGLDATTGEIVHASPAAITTYTVTGTALNGCAATATAAVGVGATVTMNSVTATPASVCSGGSTVLLANASVISTATYCVGPYSTGTGYGDYIINVTLGNINNTTGASSSPYNTYYNALSTNLTGGSGYTLTGILNNGGTEMVAAWVDYNQNGTFESGEKLGEYTGLNYSISFVVPLTALNGATRLRVRSVYNTSGILPCNTYSYGEIEDYNVVISGASSFPLTYTWSELPASGTLTSTSGNPTSATGITTDQNYTVTAMATTGCSATGNVVVNLGVPVACTNITNTNACDGVDFTVTANTTGGGGTLHYQWSDGAGGIYPDLQTITANLPAGPYTFSVTVTDGCATTCNMSQEITIGILPGGTLEGPATGLTYVPMVYTVLDSKSGSTFEWQYSTTNCNTGFTTIPGISTEEASLNASSAGTFYIRCIVTGTNGCMTITNCVTTTVTVSGDNVCNAIPLTIGLNGPFTNAGATIEAGEPVPPGTGYTTQTGWGSGQTISHTVWFSFVAPPSGRVSIGNNPNFNLWDNQFALYSGAACEGFEEFTLLAANDDSTASIDPWKAWIAPICLTPGVTYYFQTDGYGTGQNSNWGIRLKDEGNEPPVISGCPANIAVPVNASGCSANVNWTAPTASDPDNCITPLSFTSNYAPGANFPLGETTVTYTANDGINPPVTCSFTVTVSTAISASISGELTFCNESSSVLDAGSFAAYLWSTGETTQSISVTTADDFSVDVTDVFGCTASATVTTSLIPLPEAPGSPVAFNPTPTAFDLSWTYTSGTIPDHYLIDVAADNGFTLPVAGSPFIVAYPGSTLAVTGLSSSTEYFYRITAVNDCNSHYTETGSISTLCPPVTAPFVEDFETGGFAPACWANVAVTGSFVWNGSTAASANGIGTASAMANFFDQSSGTYELKTKPFDISGLTTPTLKFNFAYASYVVEIDEMDVYTSADYGKTWSLLLAMPGGPDGILNTAGLTEDAFVPTANQWCTKSLELPAGTNMVKFTAISAYGNNLYIDNITVSEPVQENNNLQNITVTGVESFYATNTLTTAGSGTYFEVASGGHATLMGGEMISLLPGTSVHAGGYLLGFISKDNYCIPPALPAVIAKEENTGISLTAFNLYPNPTSGNFTLVQKGDRQFDKVTVEVYSMRGEKLVTGLMVAEQQHEFNVSDLPVGLYFVKILAEDYTETIKLVKTR